MKTDDVMVTATIQQTRQHYRHLGLQLPDGLADDLARIEAGVDRPQLNHDAANLRDAVAAAIEAGTDPATDPAVRTELARQQLATAGLVSLFEGYDRQQRAAALRKHAPAILADLTRVVEQADATLTQARQALPKLNTTTHPPEARYAGQWGQARDAVSRLGRVVQLWDLLVGTLNLAVRSHQRNALILADLTPEQLFDLNGGDALAPVHAGYRLTLADPKTYMQRCQRIDDHLAEQAKQREREARTGKHQGVTPY